MEDIIKINHTYNNKHGFVDFSQMYHTDTQLNWNKSVNAFIPFVYDGVSGMFKLISVTDNTNVIIEYMSKKYNISKQGLKHGYFDKIIHPEKYEFYYNTDDVLCDYNRNLKIVNRKRIKHGKYYNCLCLDCNYQNDVDINEYDLKKGYGCPVCSNYKIVKGFNDFEQRHPELAKYIFNEEDRHLPSSSRQIILWHCPDCNGIIHDSISHVLNYGIICNHCNIKFSFPENVMCNILENLGIEYEKNKVFKWSSKKNGELSGNRIYDFYIPSLNCIIETHGEQHYSHPRGNWTKRTIEEEQNNDKLKTNLALQNGIVNYIVLDCRKSTIDWIKKSILSNELFCQLFNTNLIDWGKISAFRINDNYRNVCKLWNEGMPIGFIAKDLNIDRHKVSDLLKLSLENKHTTFSNEESIKRGSIVTSMSRAKPIRCITTNQYFYSISLCEKLSEEIFGVKLTNKNMSRQIKLGKPHKGFLFEYVSAEEFNKIKQESPELVFGDSFVL